MITVQDSDKLVNIGYPGYFWHVDKQCLYSIKTEGVLKRLTLTRPYRGYRGGLVGPKRLPDACTEPYYSLSVKNRRIYVTEQSLKNKYTRSTESYMIPYWK